MNYKDYLQTNHWKQFRLVILKFWDNKCCLCHASTEYKDILDVHHRNYNNLGRELITDCIVLCRKCHEHHHTVFKNSKYTGDAKKEVIANKLYAYVHERMDLEEKLSKQDYVSWAEKAKVDELSILCRETELMLDARYDELREFSEDIV